MKSHVKGPHKKRVERTRAILIGIARQLFTRQGYAGTAMEDIVQRGGLTRGALYYHFQDKRGLFAEVFEVVEQEILEEIERVARGQPDLWRGLVRGCHAFLDACLDPSRQRIVLLDAPVVLGWKQWREVDARYGFGSLCQGIQAAMDAGLLAARPVEPLAHLISGALNEAVFAIAEAENVKHSRKEIGTAFDDWLNELKLPA